MGLPDPAGMLSVVLMGWLAVAQYLGAANAYLATIENPTAMPTVLFGLLTPLAFAAIALWRSESIARLVAAIPLHWLVAAQAYRVAGGIFLVLWADGHLPWQFALPAGIGDVTTGIVAVVVAALLARNAIGAHRATYAWSLFGIADLVVAVIMGAMTSPGRAHLLAFETPNLLITSYPLVMVPTFAVPLALMLHGLVLWRLRRETPGDKPAGGGVIVPRLIKWGRPGCRSHPNPRPQLVRSAWRGAIEDLAHDLVNAAAGRLISARRFPVA